MAWFPGNPGQSWHLFTTAIDTPTEPWPGNDTQEFNKGVGSLPRFSGDTTNQDAGERPK